MSCYFESTLRKLQLEDEFLSSELLAFCLSLTTATGECTIEFMIILPSRVGMVQIAHKLCKVDVCFMNEMKAKKFETCLNPRQHIRCASKSREVSRGKVQKFDDSKTL